MSILIKPAYDTDASAYFTTAGVTSTAGRQQVSRFVTGIKNLGLWNNMVCWPLRSSQNAGTGTIAYSLGGLGAYNGTLSGSPVPSWGTNGLVAQSTNSFVQTGFAITLSTIGTFSIIGVGNIPEGANKRLVGSSGTTTYIYTTSSSDFQYSLFDGINNSQITNPSNNAIVNWACLTKNATLTTTGYVNNGSGYNNTFASLRSSSDNLAFFGSNGTSNGGVYPFFAFLNIQLSQTQNSELYSLFKSTLGQGLGLP